MIGVRRMPSDIITSSFLVRETPLGCDKFARLLGYFISGA
jgi:hypothetical protein